jgi:hypothetical protein
MTLTEENLSTRGKTYPGATLSTKNPTWTYPGSNLDTHYCFTNFDTGIKVITFLDTLFSALLA